MFKPALFNKTMIKRLLLFTIVAYLLVVASFALAQENKDASSSPTINEDKVKSLKEKLATKVAELRQSQTRGFYGEIAALSKTGFTLVTKNGEVKIRLSDDVAILKLGDKKTEGAVKDLKNTGMAATIGLFDEDANQQTATAIYLESIPKYVSGEISEVNKSKAIITLKNNKGDQLVVDYEKTTKTSEYDPTKQTVVKSGLSRFVVGDYIEVWGNVSEDDNQKLSAVKILRVPKEALSTTTLSASPTASPKVSPKATPKSSPKVSPQPTPEATPEP